ncbi:HCLS1-associated protein X-1-like [Ischnura elegans]|uniref:HCLS1-associated protein X-1-like n=1 Tax=Ischnura elegans TaxID=197161 RepID=UPI001ED8B3C5|nr:HCLS1-associated protein X-1-like [Ischnura elegans]
MIWVSCQCRRMSLYEFIRSVFGFPRPQVPADPSTSHPSRGNEFKKPVWIDEYVEEDDDILSQQQSTAMFPVLSDPLEIHRYFEQQMEYMQQMIRNFSGFPHTSIFDDKNTDVFGAIAPTEPGSRSLRDEYLKEPDGALPCPRKDTDLDHKVGAGGLGGILDEESPEKKLLMAPASPAPKFRFFGESTITRTVRKADGTVETRTTTRRSDGTEETVVSVQTPDGSSVESSRPSSGVDIFSGGAEDRFFSDLFNGFFRRN